MHLGLVVGSWLLVCVGMVGHKVVKTSLVSYTPESTLWHFQVREVFRDAVEEAKEVLDRREGKEPATDHDPLDFLREHPEYDASLVAMEFDEQFPPLSRSAATSMVAVDVIGRVRAQAKDPEGPRDGFEESERLLVWFRFHTSPESVRKKMAPRLDGRPLLLFHSSGCNSNVPVK
jgi:hypothetical protein